jgi:hypothetical protein
LQEREKHKVEPESPLSSARQTTGFGPHVDPGQSGFVGRWSAGCRKPASALAELREQDGHGEQREPQEHRDHEDHRPLRAAVEGRQRSARSSRHRLPLPPCRAEGEPVVRRRRSAFRRADMDKHQILAFAEQDFGLIEPRTS